MSSTAGINTRSDVDNETQDKAKPMEKTTSKVRMINFKAIYILWLREMKTFWRAKSRILGSLLMPVFFLAFLGTGFAGAILPGISVDITYLQFLVPGMVAMTVVFSSMFAGLSVLWDRQFGFLKEIMITPVTRVSIVMGRIAGGATTSLIQGVAILLISTLLGFKISGILPFLVSILFMTLTAVAFIGLGLALASKLKDMQGFSLIMNFLIFPLLFLSGAIFPIDNMPSFVKALSYIDPMTYGVDGMRGALLGVSSLPIALSLVVILGTCVLMVFLGAYLFEKSESV
jgi:ABC-2 type transport system permease protein